MRKLLVIGWLILLLFTAGALFWYNDLVYHLPTPIPANYKSVNTGTVIILGNTLKKYEGRPVFLNFFNPGCPCSRFNIANFKSLYHQYSNGINFVVVVMSNKTYTTKQIQDKIGLNIPVLFDISIAVSCGVYSTPQAVLLDSQHKLYYRGNYNSSRYCTDDKTNYAKIAIEGLLLNKSNLIFTPLALKAYGCRLPNCNK
jgi:AhpC/TSA family